MLTNKQPLDKIRAAVKSLHDETGSLNSSTKLELASICETTHTMDGYFTQLVNIQSNIDANMRQLEGTLVEVKSREEAAQKKWLRKLGPLELALLPDAIVILLKITAEVVA